MKKVKNGAVTTVTFEEKRRQDAAGLADELYPSKEALDEAVIGMEDVMPEQFGQLDELLVTRQGGNVAPFSPGTSRCWHHPASELELTQSRMGQSFGS